MARLESIMRSSSDGHDRDRIEGNETNLCSDTKLSISRVGARGKRKERIEMADFEFVRMSL